MFPQANAYPYYFKVVNEPSVNAFALPGGAISVHTGLSYLYAVARDAGLGCLVLAAPASRTGESDPIFKQMVGNIQIPNKLDQLL